MSHVLRTTHNSAIETTADYDAISFLSPLSDDNDADDCDVDVGEDRVDHDDDDDSNDDDCENDDENLDDDDEGYDDHDDLDYA